MGNIRLDKFFQANTNVAAVKFLKSDGNINEQSTILSSGYATADVKVLAPMEGMFVIAKNAATSLTLTIDTDMMIPDDAVHQQHSPGQGSRAAAYGGRESFPAQTPTYGGFDGASPTLRLTATMPHYRSATLLVSGDDAPTSEALLDSEVPPTLAVYALHRDSCVLDSTPPTQPCDIAPLSAAVTPLCVIAPDTATVSLTATTTGQLPRDEYYILDRISGTRWRLDDDITLEGCGTTIGRYALVHGDVYAAEPTGIDAAEADDGVTIAISGGRVTVTSTRRELRRLTLTALDGACIATLLATGHAATIDAGARLAILSVAFADGTHAAYKLRLR